MTLLNLPLRNAANDPDQKRARVTRREDNSWPPAFCIWLLAILVGRYDENTLDIGWWIFRNAAF